MNWVIEDEKKCSIVMQKTGIKKKSIMLMGGSVPAIVFDHVGKFNDVLSFLILLTQLKRLLL